MRDEVALAWPNEHMDWSIADEIVVHVTGAKAEALNLGTVRSHFRSNSDLCPVKAIASVCEIWPDFMDGDSSLYWARWRNGQLVEGATLQGLIRSAAAEMGVPEAGVSLHSLRAGGATALYQATQKKLKKFMTPGYFLETQHLPIQIGSLLIY